MRNIYILGATGSIGTQTLDVIRNNKTEFNVIGLSLGRDNNQNFSIIDEFKPQIVCLRYEEQLSEYKKYKNVEFVYGDLGLLEIATYKEEGLLVNALSGSSGLLPTIKSIESKKDILLANKETLVMAGDIIKELIKIHKVKLYPIDSEHNALWQLLENTNKDQIKKIVITASGGAFRDLSREELQNVTKNDALRHPTWNMGQKITIDSATMVNKGLEVIEAHYLFDLPYEKIDTILHKESTCHGLVHFYDGTIKASLSISDMRIPITYALFFPKRIHSEYDFDLTNLTFKKMDLNRYPLLKLAYEVGIKKGLYPTVYNASNEAAVSLFLQDKISFLDIEHIIFESVEKFSNNTNNPNIELIIKTDLIVKEEIYTKYEKR